MHGTNIKLHVSKVYYPDVELMPVKSRVSFLVLLLSMSSFF
jgi:hypothetical protein